MKEGENEKESNDPPLTFVKPVQTLYISHYSTLL